VYCEREVAKTVLAGRRLRALRSIAGCCAGLLGIAFSGCGGAEQDPPEVENPIASEMHDSGGIRIIENDRPPDGSRLDWRIGPEPAVSIGTREGEDPYLLHRVSDATRMRDGRIVVANGGSSELRFFDSLGNHLANRGGSGEGPGEFVFLRRVDPWPGDSIVAWEAPRLGFSVFDSGGSFGRTFTLLNANPRPLRPSPESAAPATTPAGHQGGPVPRGMSAGMLLWLPVSATTDGGILAIAGGTDENTTVAQIRGSEGGELSSPVTHPGPEPMLLTQAYAGEPAVVPWGDLMIVTSTMRYELKAFGRDGELARIVRRGHELRAPTEAEVFAYMEENSPPGMSPEQIRRQFQSLTVPEHFPAFGRIMTDAAGHLWVREYDLPDMERDAPLWTVFDAEGRVLGFVETPKGLGIYEIGEDYILGKVRDELMVEHVQLWPLARSGM